MKPWLVAHRGAPNEAQENTLAAFEAARKYAVGYLEFDVRVTKDGVAVIHHDPMIGLSAIAETDYQALLSLDPQLTTFEAVVAAHSEIPLFVELKSSGSAAHTLDYLRTHPESYATSFLESELLILKHAGIASQRLFIAQYHHPIGLLRKVQRNQFGGVTLNRWYLTPLFYWRARRKGARIMIYVVNGSLWARMVRVLYRDVFICTDMPQLFDRFD